MDYPDKLLPRPWYIFTPPQPYIFAPPLTLNHVNRDEKEKTATYFSLACSSAQNASKSASCI